MSIDKLKHGELMKMKRLFYLTSVLSLTCLQPNLLADQFDEMQRDIEMSKDACNGDANANINIINGQTTITCSNGTVVSVEEGPEEVGNTNNQITDSYSNSNSNSFSRDDCTPDNYSKHDICADLQLNEVNRSLTAQCENNEDCEVINQHGNYNINGKHHRVYASENKNGSEGDRSKFSLHQVDEEGFTIEGSEKFTTIDYASNYRKTSSEEQLDNEVVKDEVVKDEVVKDEVVKDEEIDNTEKESVPKSKEVKKTTEVAGGSDKASGSFLEVLNTVGESSFPDEDMDAAYPGTPMFKECQKVITQAESSWLEITNTDTNSFYAVFSKVANHYTKKSMDANWKPDNVANKWKEVKKIKNADGQMSPSDKEFLSSAKKPMMKAASSALKRTRNCILLVEATRGNFHVVEGSEPIYKDKEYRNPETQKSFDQRLKCQSNGLETMDFVKCNSMLLAYNASKIAIEGNNAIQAFQAQEYGNEANLELMNSTSDGSDVSTKALEVQRDGISKQKTMAETRSALQAAKVAAMAGYAKSLPDQDEIVRLCAAGNKMSPTMTALSLDFKSALSVSSRLLDVYGGNDEDQCTEAYETGQHALLMNRGQVAISYAIAAEAGVEATKEFMAADTLDRQKGMIDGVIDRVKGMETVDLPESAFQTPEMVTFCQANPNAQECVGFGAGMTTNVQSGGLSFTGGLGTNEVMDVPTSSDNATAITDGSTDESSAITGPKSRAIASVDKGGGFSGPTAGKAKISSAPVGSSGGAGGGGAPSSGGLSGSGPGGSGVKGASSRSGKRYKLGYSGGSRPLSFRGGRKSSSRSKKSGFQNPFAKMGKKKSKTDVFNFRGLASKDIGGKNGNLFKRISKSYETMNKKDRLLKYKLAE